LLADWRGFRHTLAAGVANTCKGDYRASCLEWPEVRLSRENPANADVY
jgi:hypothetical protein